MILRFSFISIYECIKGAVWPSLVGIFKHWTPPLEKSRLIGFAVSGKDIGNMLGFPLGGWLCINGFDDGWGSIFYIFGMFRLNIIIINLYHEI